MGTLHGRRNSSLIKDGKNQSVTAAEARKTALIVAGVLLLFAGWNYYRERMTLVVVLCSVAVAFVLMGFIPAVAKLFHVNWMRLALILGWINSHILLGLMFYCIFAPFNFVARLLGRDPLKRRGSPMPTYWQPRKQTRQEREQFEHPF